MSKYDSTVSSTITGVIALSVTLLTTALVPVDVFLVSFMKNSDGTFKVLVAYFKFFCSLQGRH